MKFRLRTIATQYTKDDAYKLMQLGFAFVSCASDKSAKPYELIKNEERPVHIHIGDLHALLGLIEKVGSIIVHDGKSKGLGNSLIGSNEPEITICDDYMY